MQKLTIIGNLTHNPETRTTQSGVSVCSFTVAVNRRFANQDGEKQTDFFRINAWRGLADTCAKYLAKGRKVAVIGELQARMYDGKDGEKRMSLDVQADEVEFLTPKSQAEQTEQTEPEQQPKTDENGFTDVNTMDLPF